MGDASTEPNGCRQAAANVTATDAAPNLATVTRERCRLQCSRVPLIACILPIAILILSAAAPEKHLAVYSTAANYSLPIVQRQGHEYIGLLELLDPLGTVSAKSDPPRWRIHYNNILGEFTVGHTHARVQGRDADLAGKFLMENGRGLVPLASLGSLLPRFLGGPATLHQESGRLFIGNIATHFTASVSPEDTSHLVFRFTAPVNPSVATEAGKTAHDFQPRTSYCASVSYAYFRQQNDPRGHLF